MKYPLVSSVKHPYLDVVHKLNKTELKVRGFQILRSTALGNPRLALIIARHNYISSPKRRGYSHGPAVQEPDLEQIEGSAIANNHVAQGNVVDSQPDRIVVSGRHTGAETSRKRRLTSRTTHQPVRNRKGSPGTDSSKSHSIALKREHKTQEKENGVPPKTRQRKAAAEPFVNEAYIRKTFQIPSSEDYPAAPRALFEGPSLVSTIYNLGRNWNMTKRVSSHGPNAGFECSIAYDVPQFGQFTAVAHGLNKREAMRNSNLLILANLHERGILREIFPVESLDEEIIEEEVDAKVDVYNYAARFGLVPRVSFRSIKHPLRVRKKLFVEMTIELPEQNIKVVSRGLNLAAVEISTSVKFKQEAEKYYAEHGEDIIVIKDSNSLNSSNMKNFLDFYKSTKKHTDFSINTVEDPTLNATPYPHKSQVLLNGLPVGKTVLMTGKKKIVEQVAYLTAAVELTRDDPELLPAFRKAISASSSGLLLPLKPQDVFIDVDAALIMGDTLQQLRLEGLQDEKAHISPSEEADKRNFFRARPKPSPAQIKARSISLQRQYNEYLNNPQLTDLRAKRKALPMTQHRNEVLNHVESNQYSVIIGATGCGKTTQVPQILLEQAIMNGRGGECAIVCTQPRRIAAISIARRVAEERNERLQESLGYHVRFDAKPPISSGNITYCTTGILLQQVQHHPDEVFDKVSHIIVDEVHERDISIDFLLVILKRTVAERRKTGKSVPHIVLMSATIDSKLFSDYFATTTSAGEHITCPSLHVPGRSFPVAEKYLDQIVDELKATYSSGDLNLLLSDDDTKTYLAIENQLSTTTIPRAKGDGTSHEGAIDWKRETAITSENGIISNEQEDALIPRGLVTATVAHIARSTVDGAILVFLPGLDAIQGVEEALKSDNVLGVDFSNRDKYRLCILHSTVPAAEQAAVFEAVPPGCRKIILSTNIAETSVTIPDIQFVVDTGKQRELRYDLVRRITKLQCTWISKSNAKQRAGRAGRVQDGTYYALYSKPRFDLLRAVGLPEILRSDLQEICLDIKAQKFKIPIRTFLAEAIEPPSAIAVNASVENLISLEALTQDEELTALGHLLASLPVHPSLGKMIVLGVIFRCLDPMIILGSIINDKNFFVHPIDGRKMARAAHREFIEDTESDHLALLYAFRQLRKTRYRHGHQAASDLAFEKFLHFGAFRTLASTTLAIEEILVEAGLIPFHSSRLVSSEEIGGPAFNKNSDNLTLVKALTLAGLHPNLARATSSMTFRTPGEKNTMIHPSSLNYARRKGDEDRANLNLVSYSTMNKSSDGRSIYLKDVTAVSPLMALLFGGHLAAKGNHITMDDWLPFHVKGNSATSKLIIEFRKAMDRVLTSAFGNLANIKDKISGKYLADERIIEIFASGVIEVLNRDVRISGKGTSFYDAHNRTHPVYQNESNMKHIFETPRQEPRYDSHNPFTSSILEALEKDLIQWGSRRSK